MFNKLTTEKVSVDKFINTHTHINYCEAIIYKDGAVAYAVPSHTKALERETGKTQDELMKEMPNDGSTPIEWLANKTGCICVWTCGFVAPDKVSDKQLDTLNKLIERGLVKDNKLMY